MVDALSGAGGQRRSLSVCSLRGLEEGGKNLDGSSEDSDPETSEREDVIFLAVSTPSGGMKCGPLGGSGGGPFDPLCVLGVCDLSAVVLM